MGKKSGTTSETPTILVIGHVDNSVQRAVRLGILACGRSRGWTIVSEFGESKYLEEWIADWRPRSVLMAMSDAAEIARAAALAPTVAALSYADGLQVPAVDVDQDAVARMAADHLIGLGLRTFAVLGAWNFRWAVDRARAFERYIKAAGFDCHVCSGNELRRPIVETMMSITASRPMICQWVESLPKPIGIFACNDSAGQQLANHCRTIGVRVPEDAAIVGVDNDEVICEMSVPPLSSVAVNMQQIGHDAAELAGRLAEAEPVEPTRRLLGPAGVVTRQSSDLLAVDDPDVAEALRVIREHADRPFTVSELLRRFPVNRRRLERRFRDLVGRRMLQEMRRLHVEQAKRLLVSTDMSMSEIAERSGFLNAVRLAIAFREETGQTASAFRQRFRLRA